MAPSGRASVLIFDHQPLLVRGLASLLRDEVGVTAFVSSGRPDLLAAEMADFSPDVVVLAQASMAPAVALLQDVAIPVLSSPVPGLRQALGISAPGVRPGR